jgi:3-keto-disaccharide hydrolase
VVSRSETLGPPAKVNPLRFWNKLKLVCQGETLKVWLNDHFLGQMPNTGLKKGLIALKGNRNDIYFRNIEIRILDATPPKPPPPEPAFRPLFNGKNLDGWAPEVK